MESTDTYWFTYSGNKSRIFEYEDARDTAAQYEANKGHTVVLYRQAKAFRQRELTEDKAAPFKAAKVGTVWGRYSQILGCEVRLLKVSDDQVLLTYTDGQCAPAEIKQVDINDTHDYLNAEYKNFKELTY
jgi:hypothetical protein